MPVIFIGELDRKGATQCLPRNNPVRCTLAFGFRSLSVPYVRSGGCITMEISLIESPIQPGGGSSRLGCSMFQRGSRPHLLLGGGICLQSVPTPLISVEEKAMWISFAHISYKDNLSWIHLGGVNREWILLFNCIFERNSSNLNSMGLRKRFWCHSFIFPIFPTLVTSGSILIFKKYLFLDGNQENKNENLVVIRTILHFWASLMIWFALS